MARAREVQRINSEDVCRMSQEEVTQGMNEVVGRQKIRRHVADALRLGYNRFPCQRFLNLGHCGS